MKRRLPESDDDAPVSRFGDDLHLVDPADYVPTSVGALLMHLHLLDAPRAEQEAGIRSWLAEHEPCKLMVFTLQRKGFGYLLATS